MTSQTLSQLLVLLLCGIASLRIFFIQDSRSDPVATVPSFALLISLLNILAFGCGPFEVANLALSVFAFIINFRSLLRFKSKLVVDHYSVLFILSSALNLIFVAVLLVLVLYYRPSKANLKKFNVRESSYSFYGNFSQGFKQIDKIFTLNSAVVKKYEAIPPKSQEAEECNADAENIVLFVPNECCAIQDYEPILVKLAHDGYTVYAADFFPDDLHWFNDWRDFKSFRRSFMRWAKLYNKKAYREATMQKYQNLLDSYNSLAKMLDIKKGTFVFALSDDGLNDGGSALHSASPDIIFGSFDIGDVPGNPTPGYGPVQQTDPVFARFLGLKRDRSLYMPSHVATVAEEKIRLTQEISAKVLGTKGE
ncbi:MAG: hypothetical protein J6X11_09530 [Treponema sp.]|nr:hypothetical protein [Treponema sp.]